MTCECTGIPHQGNAPARKDGSMTEYHCKYDELVDPATLVDHPRNVNTHPRRQLDALSAVIWGPKGADGARDAKHALGWRHSVVVSRQSGCIVMGHARKTVAIEEGELVPISYQDFASEADERAMLRADNRIAELAELDIELEQIELRELAALDIPVLDFGFEIKSINIPEIPDIEIQDKISLEKITIFVEESLKREVIKKLRDIESGYDDGLFRIIT